MKKIRLYIELITIMLVSGMIIWAKDTKIQASFKYKNYLNGKTVNYSGTVPVYIIDGNKAELSKEPALISDRNVAYASANGLFRDALGIKTKYSRSQKRISFKYQGHTLLMYVGETRAVLDGVETEAPCAPFRIKYKESGKVATMVPTRFVAESFGMNYVWKSDSGTVTIKTPFRYIRDDAEYAYTGTKGRISFEGEMVEQYGEVSLIVKDTALISTGTDLFGLAGIDFQYDRDTGLIILKYNGNVIRYCAGSRIAYVNGLFSRCSYEPAVFKVINLAKDILYIPGRFSMENLGFDYNWNYEEGISEISVVEGRGSNEVQFDHEFLKEKDSLDQKESDLKEKDGLDQKEFDLKEKDSLDQIELALKDDQNGSNEKAETEPQNNTDINETDELVDGTGIRDFGDDEKDPDGQDNIETGSEGDSEADIEGIKVSDSENAYINEDGEILVNVFNTSEGYKFFIDKDDCSDTLKLPVPKKIKAKDISVKEDSMNCMTELVIKGDYSEFYKDAMIGNSGKAILQIQIYYDPADKLTKIRLFSDVILNCTLSDAKKGHYVTAQLNFAKNHYDKVIVIDAGHGDHDPGAQHKKVKEKDLNLKLLLNCKELFDESDIRVYYTRTDDSFLELSERAGFAEMVGADMFISIHHNSNEHSSPHGTSVYYSEMDKYTSLNGLTSEKLAEKMLDSLLDALGTKKFSTGVIAEDFVVVRDSKAPAVLLEIGFMSNDDELDRLVTDSFSKKAAKAIYDAVIEIYGGAYGE